MYIYRPLRLHKQAFIRNTKGVCVEARELVRYEGGAWIKEDKLA